jgi:hypothetical protein
MPLAPVSAMAVSWRASGWEDGGVVLVRGTVWVDWLGGGGVDGVGLLLRGEGGAKVKTLFVKTLLLVIGITLHDRAAPACQSSQPLFATLPPIKLVRVDAS